MDWHPMRFTYGTPDPILFRYASAEAVQVLITFYPLMMPDWNPSEPAVAQHHRIMAEYGGPSPSALTILSQVAGEIVVETLRRSCDNLTREGIMEANLSFSNCPKWRPSLLYYGLTVGTSDADHRLLEGGFPMQVVFDQYQPVWSPILQSGFYPIVRSGWDNTFTCGQRATPGHFAITSS